MGQYVALNNAFSTLAGSLTAVATSVTVQSGHGSRFAVGTDYSFATLESAGGNLEVIKITAQAGDTLTVVRAQDGTTALTWNIADIIEIRPCKAAIDAIKADTVTSADIGTQIHNATEKTSIVAADEIGIADSAASFVKKRLTFANMLAAIQPFVTGTKLLFFQSGAPTGWTQDTTHNNKAMRVVSGAGGGSGGTTAFTSVFASRTPAGTNSVTVTAAGSVSLSAGGSVTAASLSTAQLASHSHYLSDDTGIGLYGQPSTSHANQGAAGTFPSGSGSTHTHTFTNPTYTFANSGSSGTATFTGTAMDFAVQYVDLIICTKN